MKGLFKRKGPGEKRSPLKRSPLRNPGQSVDEEILRINRDIIGDYLEWSVIFIVLAIYEWIRDILKIAPHPLLFSVLAVGVSGYGIFRVLGYKKQIRNLRLARDGEKAVGQYLDRFSEKGNRVFHDVVGKGFNIDHVLIGPAGVYTLETKTISKPARGSAEIIYDGETISINGFVPDRNRVVQPTAKSSWLQYFIKHSTGRAVKVRPVVLYPGWFISKMPKGAEVWVLNPKGLPAFLEQEGRLLTPEDVTLIAYHLTRYVAGGQTSVTG